MSQKDSSPSPYLFSSQGSGSHVRPSPITRIHNPYKVQRRTSPTSYNNGGSNTLPTSSSNNSNLSRITTPSPSPTILSRRRQLASPKSVVLWDGRSERLPHNTLLLAVLLQPSLSDLLQSAQNFQAAEAVLAQMCDCLQIPSPPNTSCGWLASKYDYPKAHMESRAALVLEEARFLLCEALHSLLVDGVEAPFVLEMKPVTSSSSYGKNSSTTALQLETPTTFRRTQYNRGAWFTSTQLSHLIPGQVLYCTDGYEMEKLGVVSTNTNTPTNMAKYGLLDIQFFDPSFGVPSAGGTWTIRPVGHTLISLAREFAAVTEYDTVPPFFDVIRGTRVPTDPATLGGRSSRLVQPSSLRDSTTPPLPHLKGGVMKPQHMHIPQLNEAQQRAATLFLQANEGSVTVVQGPPGTGKTNLAVGVIGKYLLQASSQPHRVLVCAPTNKAISHIAKRFLQSIIPSPHTASSSSSSQCGLNVIALGNEEKLGSSTDDPTSSSSMSFPYNMKSIYLFSWIKGIIEAYTMLKMGVHGPGTMNDRREKKRMLDILQHRLYCSLGELPVDLKLALKAINDVPLLNTGVDFDPTLLDGKIDDVTQIIQGMDPSVIRTTLLNSAHVIFSTLSATRSTIAMSADEVDCLIVDEAAAATEPALYIPFHLQPKKMLLVGDPMQLPAVVKSPIASRLGLSESFHERLMERLFCREFVLLDTQYRMKPEISSFPSHCFYSGMLRNGGNVVNPYYGTDAIPFLQGRNSSFIFYRVIGDAVPSSGMKSFANPAEVDAVMQLLCHIRAREPGFVWGSEARLRIITFYHGQVTLIRQCLSKYHDFCKISVETVDSTQGCESDIVILSFVKGSSSAGFLKDDRRLNVALTRARHQLICIGDVESMQYLNEPGASTLRLLSRDAFQRGCVV